MLLSWLCQKHRLLSPVSSLLKDQAKPSTPAKGPTSPKTPRLPAAVPAPNIGATAPVERTHGQDDPQSPPTRIATARGEDRPMVPVTPSTAATSGLGGTGRVALEVGHLRSLKGLDDHFERDKSRSGAQIINLKASTNSMRRGIASIRQDLRGKFLSQVPLIANGFLTEQERYHLVGKLQPCTVGANERIVTEGEVGDKMYIIEHGSCIATKLMYGRPLSVGRLGKGAFFGEMSVLYDMPRTATVVTREETSVLSLSRKDLLSSVRAEVLHTMKVVARTQVMQTAALLADLDSKQKLRIAAALKSQRWYKGMLLAGKEHITSRLFCVEEGIVELDTNKSLPAWMRSQKATLGPGQFFGMRGLLYGAPFGFNVVAKSEEVWTLSISYEELLDAGAESPEEREAIATTMHNSMKRFLLRQIPQLESMADPFFEVVQKQAAQTKFKKWTVIFSKGESLRSLFVLQEGKVVPYDGDTHEQVECAMAEPERGVPGEVFGLDCLTNPDAKAPCTLVASTDVVMLQLPLEAIWSVQNLCADHVARIYLFGGDVVNPVTLEKVVRKLRPFVYGSGEEIIKEGEIGDVLFIIEAGTCDVNVTVHGREKRVAQLRTGQSFGELAVMYDIPYSATVRATSEVVAVGLSREDIRSSVSAESFKKMRDLARTQVFSQLPLLSNFPSRHLAIASGRMQSDVFKKGQQIVGMEEPTLRMFMIERGEASVEAKSSFFLQREIAVFHGGDSDDASSATSHQNDDTHTVIHAGHWFGTVGLLDASPYNLNISAYTDEVAVLSISLQDLVNSVGPGERAAMERGLREALRCNILKHVPVLSDKDPKFFKNLLHQASFKTYVAGDVIAAKGEPCWDLLVLETGLMGELPSDVGPAVGSATMAASASPVEWFGLHSRDKEVTAGTLVAMTDCALMVVPCGIHGLHPPRFH